MQKMADFGGKFQRTRIIINYVEYSKVPQMPISGHFSKHNERSNSKNWPILEENLNAPKQKNCVEYKILLEKGNE